MKKAIKTIMVCWLAAAVHVQGQEVTFISPNVEESIRQHLCISDEENICFAQLDTITTLDLSKRNVTDIHDLLLLPNLRSLDLSNNMVDDLQPLTMLDSLEWIDLSYNNLKTVNELVFSNSRKMTVNVAFNHIGDFSIFGSMTRCNFIFEGSTLQLKEDAPYFNVSKLYCDASVSPSVIHTTVRTNMTEPARLLCGGGQMEVPTNVTDFSQAIQDEPSETVPVYINNGVRGDSTYYVPSITLDVNPGETLTLPTGLPESYTIYLTNAVRGAVVIDGTDLVYTAPDIQTCDTISFCYNEFGMLKGFSRYYLGKPRIHLGDVNGDGVVNITDISLIVAHILGETLPVFIKQNADMNNDKSINVTDVTSVVGIVLNELAPKAPANARYDVDDRVVLAGNSSGCSICLDGNAPFTACEMTLTLPEGCTLLDASLDSHQPTSHQVAVQSIGDGRYRLVVYAPADGRSRLGEGALVNLGLNGRSDGIKVSDIMFSNRQYETVVLQDAVGMTTGLDGVLSTDAADDTYSIQGIKTTTPRKGVYIKGHKKKVVKH